MTRGYWFLVLCLLPLAALAHKNSDSFLYLHDQMWRLDIAVEDLQRLHTLDVAPRDAAVSVAEVRQAEPALRQILLADLSLSRDGAACPLDVSLQGFTQHSDGQYAVWQLLSPCLTTPAGLTFSYRLLFDIDPFHRVLYDIQLFGESAKQGVLGPSRPSLLVAQAAAWHTLSTFLWQGMLHMLLGYDHLLFLLALLLPIAHGVGSQRSHREVWRSSIWVITAFTVAHSVTLVAATLGWVRLPSGPVELVIALSIAISALLALSPQGRRHQWPLAAGFGLIHGFGFATMLSELLSGWRDTALALASFNVGVEVAQLLVMAVLIPLLIAAERASSYRRYGYPVVLLVIAAMGLWWAFERL